MPFLFVYGTLMRGYGLHRLLAGSRFVGEARTKDKFTLYASGIPFMVDIPLHYVYGELYEVEDELFETLDEIEYGYERRLIPVVLLEGKEYLAYAYIYPHPLDDSEIVPTGNYRDL